MSAIFFKPEKNLPAPFGALPAHFLRGPEKSKNCPNFAYFPWWANGPIQRIDSNRPTPRMDKPAGQLEDTTDGVH